MKREHEYDPNEFEHYKTDNGMTPDKHAADQSRYDDAMKIADKAGDAELCSTIGKMKEKDEAAYGMISQNERGMVQSKLAFRRSEVNDPDGERAYNDKKAEHLAASERHADRYVELREDLAYDPRAEEAQRLVSGESMEIDERDEFEELEQANDRPLTQAERRAEDGPKAQDEPQAGPQVSSLAEQTEQADRARMLPKGFDRFDADDWQKDCLDAEANGRHDLSAALESAAQRDLHSAAARGFGEQAAKASAQGNDAEAKEWGRMASGHLKAKEWADSKLERSPCKAEAEEIAKGWTVNKESAAKAQERKTETTAQTAQEREAELQRAERPRTAIEDGPRNLRRKPAEPVKDEGPDKGQTEAKGQDDAKADDHRRKPDEPAQAEGKPQSPDKGQGGGQEATPQREAPKSRLQGQSVELSQADKDRRQQFSAQTIAAKASPVPVPGADEEKKRAQSR